MRAIGTTTNPSCVEGVSGKGRIVEQWRLHFENLFNCVQDLDRNDMSFNAEYNDDIVVIVQEQILIGGQIRKIVQHILQKRFDLSRW